MASKHHTRKVSKDELNFRKKVVDILNYIKENSPTIRQLESKYSHYPNCVKLARQIIENHNKGKSNDETIS